MEAQGRQEAESEGRAGARAFCVVSTGKAGRGRLRTVQCKWLSMASAVEWFLVVRAWPGAIQAAGVSQPEGA